MVRVLLFVVKVNWACKVAGRTDSKSRSETTCERVDFKPMEVLLPLVLNIPIRDNLIFCNEKRLITDRNLLFWRPHVLNAARVITLRG